MTDLEDCISLGPWGGRQGKKWKYMPQGFIKKISIRHGGVIDSIKFQTDSTPIFGGKGGNRTDTICIDYPKEYLTSISGTVGNYDGFEVVMSLCFVTNTNHYGPYGSDSGTRFSYNGKGGIIVGFYGHVRKYLDAIGIYVMPKSFALARNSAFKDNSTHEVHPLVSKSPILFCSRTAMPRDAGPWGASGGKPWDDGVFSNVQKVIIHGGVSFNAIRDIQFLYVKKDAKSVLSTIHGGTSEDEMELLSTVNLDGVDESFIGISGFYGPVKGYKGLEAITSITFHTNKTIYGPFGEESGEGYTYFTSTATPGKVVGFHGRNDGFLSAIGVHMEYL